MVGNSNIFIILKEREFVKLFIKNHLYQFMTNTSDSKLWQYQYIYSKSDILDDVLFFLENGKTVDWKQRSLSDLIPITNDRNNSWSFIKYSEAKKNKENDEDVRDSIVHLYQTEQIDYQDIKLLKILKSSYFVSQFLNIKKYLSNIWIYAADDIFDINIYIFPETIRWVKAKRQWMSSNSARSMHLSQKSYESDNFVFYHEMFHLIWELFVVNWKRINWYARASWSWLLLEWCTDVLWFWVLKIETWSNSKLYPHSDWYQNMVIRLAKFIDLASKKSGKTLEYIYKYLMRWYIIKWYLWLDIFYRSFDEDEEIIRNLIELWFEDQDELIFMNFLKKKYKELGFINEQNVIDYFDKKNKPSKEIGDIMWIER